MEFRKLLATEIKNIYEHLLSGDFPPDERKSYAMISALVESELYLGFGLFEEGELLAYALLVRAEANSYLLLDYLAVRAPYRAAGLGSFFIHQLAEACSSYGAILGEIERLDLGKDAEESKLRRRRFIFYQRAGWQASKIRCRLIGVEYQIIFLPLADQMPDDKRLRAELDSIYHQMFTDEFYRSEVLIHPMHMEYLS